MKWLWIAGGTMGALLVGCGGSSVAFTDDSGTDSSTGDDSASEGGADAGADGSTDGTVDDSGDATPTDAAPETITPTTLDNVCTRLADGVCTKAAQTCCTKSSLGWDEGGCRENVMASCGENVTAAKAGTKKFNPGVLPKCVEAWGKLETACSVNLLEFLRTYPPCQELFSGTVAAGAACKVDGDCASSGGAFADCVDTGFPYGLQCRTYTVVAKDAACKIAGSTQAICDLGLYCAVTGWPVPGDSGTCKTAKKLGEACDAGNWTECGYGYICQGGFPPTSPKCVVGGAPGSSCTRDQDCASWQCTSYKCGPTSFPVATRELCGGT